MAKKETWFNTDFFLWQDKDGEKVFLHYVSIERIIWEWPNVARLILCGRLPEATNLLEMEDGVCLELTKWSCGPIYEPDLVVFRFYDGKVRRKWTPHFIVTRLEHQGAVEIYVSLECKYQKFFEGTEG